MSPGLVGAPPGGRFRALSISLLVGAVYDSVLAGLLLLAPELLARAFDLPLPGEPFYLRSLAVLLAMLACVYVVTARDPVTHRAFVGIAILGRFAGFVALALPVLVTTEPAGVWGPAIADLGFAVVHAVTGRGLWL